MWKQKRINDTDYFLNIQTQSSNLYKFCLTDFCKLWCVEITKEQIVEQCQTINQWLEAENETLLEESIKLFDTSRTDVNWSFNSNQLLLDSTFGGIKFSFRVDFLPSNEENFSKVIVSPLLLIIKNLQQQKEYLKTCLKKKDTEIAEYKLDGAVLSRKNIETPVFYENLIPNLSNTEYERISFRKTSDLVDDQIISSYNEVYPLIGLSTEGMNLQKNVKDENIQKEKPVTQESNKVPKKNLSDLVIRVEGKNDSACSTPLPIPNPIRKKPQPRKLKNL